MLPPKLGYHCTHCCDRPTHRPFARQTCMGGTMARVHKSIFSLCIHTVASLHIAILLVYSVPRTPRTETYCNRDIRSFGPTVLLSTAVILHAATIAKFV